MMKSTYAICLALLVGFVLGTLLHAAPVKADGPTTVYVDQLIASGTKQSHTISGDRVVVSPVAPACRAWEPTVTH
ncbi:MAG: hypothetical protein WA824_12885 [Candidatus Sulfotelmatobacter sp.]